MNVTAFTIALRADARPSDSQAVREIVASTGFFSAEETAIAVELIDDRLANGESSHYQFIFADDPASQTAGFACYGRISGTLRSFDLYWIAVRHDHRGAGIGRVMVGSLMGFDESDMLAFKQPNDVVYRVRLRAAGDAALLDYYESGKGPIDGIVPRW